MMSDLKELEDIEQDADVIVFFYCDDYYDHEVENKGQIELKFFKEYGGFASVGVG